MVNEGALIAFTLISQLVVGSLLVYTMIFFTGQGATSQLSSGFNAKTPEIFLLAGMVIATAISFLHLGNPVNAIDALNNFTTSWLSREVLSLSLFSISLFLLFLGRWLMNSRQRIISILFLLSAIAGIYFIIVMIRLYTIPVVVTWATWHTPLSFAFTTLILGICGVLAYFMIFNQKIEKIKPLLQLLMVFLFIEALISVLNYRMLTSISIPHTNQFLLDNLHFNYTIIRIAAITSVLIFLVLISRLWLRQERLSTMKVLIVLAIILVFFEQYAGRYLFYAGFVKTGI
jgi:DMSO reductase anchor subunit